MKVMDVDEDADGNTGEDAGEDEGGVLAKAKAGPKSEIEVG